MNWNEKRRPDDYGNILFNDCKFLKLLYSSHYDTFKGEEYVIDATDEVKSIIGIYVNNYTDDAGNNVVSYHRSIAKIYNQFVAFYNS